MNNSESNNEIKENKDNVKDTSVPLPPSVPIKERKPKDNDFVEYSKRPYLEGTTTVKLSNLHNSRLPAIDHPIPNHWLQFDLKPRWFGSPSSPIIYYNAQDPQFYYYEVPNPRFTLWLLIKNTTFASGGYVKRRLVEEAIQQNIQVWLINPQKLDLALINRHRFTDGIVYGGRVMKLPDAVIPRVGANVDYFGMAAMRQLELWGVKVFNPSWSIEISRDKLYTHQVLGAAGIPIPKSVLSKFPFDFKYIESHFKYPIIVKLTSGSKGEAVWKVDSTDELKDLVNTLDQTKPIIFQEFLHESIGKDLRCFVVGDKVVSAMMRVALQGFKANVHQGGSVIPVTVGPELNDIAVRTAKLCGLDISGVDVLLSENTYKICEVNSSPGFQGLEKAAQMNIALYYLNHVRDWCIEHAKDSKYDAGEYINIPVPDSIVKQITEQIIIKSKEEQTQVNDTGDEKSGVEQITKQIQSQTLEDETI